MTLTFAGLLAAIALQSAPPPLVANGSEAEASQLYVGNTGIRCLQMPCPGRGVYEPDDAGNADRNALLYADTDGRTGPPPMIGDEAAIQAITKAWDDFGCIAIDGRLVPGGDDRPVLRVDEVVGPCYGL